ncbi:MAG: hypothetical protein CME06_17680 [Gemmatimonadetes bacterium]|nr:hypothetical protein [Gemmatimonadota bacterium]
MLRIIPRRLLALGLTAPLFALAGNAGATTIVKRTLDEMVREVDRIVVGEIVSVEQDWDDDEMISTFATLRVDQQILGDATSATIELRSPGGTIGEFSTTVPGSPEIDRIGSRMIVFLWNDRAESMSNVAYWGLGQYLVSNEGIVERTGQPLSEFVHHLETRIERAGR